MSAVTRLFALSLWLFCAIANSAEEGSYDLNNLSAVEAFEKGRLLRAQFKNVEGRRYLKFAAELGNPNAAYLYAMELASYKSTIRTPPESKHYLMIAAKNGSRKAMQFLYLHANWLEKEERNLWKKNYYNAVINLGREEPGQAFYELALYHQGSDAELSQYYLSRAAAFNHPHALMDLASQIEAGKGTYVLPGSRETNARHTYLKAAETGYLPAILNYIKYLESAQMYGKAYEWRVKAMEAGDLTSLPILASLLTEQSEPYGFVESDFVTAKAYLSVYLESAGRDKLPALYSNVETLFSNLSLVVNDTYDNKLIILENKIKSHAPFYNHDTFWDY
ncbi:sel1 repeat family protein [Vibrio rotiferianus]|uniref:sel1 repeat family protein n=1 Tax=Vibrio rotiferianus TaxID=190895 RepID=UPI002893EB03|nr:conserved exported hypothetical protein [Vibrio rotiferianus]